MRRCGRTLGIRLLITWILALEGVGLRAQEVFRFTSEVRASSTDGTSARSKVTCALAPGPVWHWVGFAAETGVDVTMSQRTPQNLYARRGGLFGLKPGERMCFGVLKHHGSASAGGRSLQGPGSNQQNTAGTAWTMREDAARFVRDKEGGIIECTPQVYLDEDPPEFCLLGPGSVSFGSAGDEAYRALMSFRLSNEDLRNLQRLHKVQEGSFTSEDGSITQHYKLTLEGAPPEDETEASVTVDESLYSAWIPAGKLDAPDEPGEKLRVTVKIHKKGDPGTPRLAKLSFSLEKPSRNKGVCMNWPRNADPAEGLRFRQEDQVEKDNLEVDSRTRAHTPEEAEQVELVVGSHDYGAYGTLRITARDLTGREVTVKVRGKDTPDLDIPQDDNGNRMADAWERSRGVLGQAMDSDDETEPAGKGDATKGDGLTLYEEYRGFRVKGSHVYGDPRKKDLFVCDDTIGQVAASGIGLFEAATGLNVHRVDYEELGADRVININRGEGSRVAQHGLRIVGGSKGQDPLAVGTRDDGACGPPVLTKEIQLPPGRDYGSGDGLADAAHELCHGVGIDHHGSGLVAVLWYWQQQGDGSWQLMEEGLDVNSTPGTPKRMGGAKPIQAYWEKDLKPLSYGDSLPSHFARRDKWQGWILMMGTARSEMSGDQECLLRYADKQAFQDDVEPGRVRYIPDPSQWKMRQRLCDSPAGTGVNAPDHRPQSRYGDASMGNCKSQLVVCDAYAGK